MEYNLITNIESCYFNIPRLLYYSHIPTLIIAFLFGLFVYLKSKTLVSKILFSLSIIFSLWLIFNLIVWVSPNSMLVVFFWSFFEILNGLLFILALYFVYVFIEKKDVSFLIKLTVSSLLLPIIILSPTVHNIKFFDATLCEATQNTYFVDYIFFLEIGLLIWIIMFLLYKYIKANKEFRKQIASLAFGMILFLASFFVSTYVAVKIDNFELEQYGLIGMVIFMGFLAYIIVRYKAFNIKLIGAQALVVALVVLIGSQFFFIQNNTNKILTGITLALALGFGYILIKSVKLEVERKEQLQLMTDSLAQANDQLRKLDNAKTEFISIASHQLRTPVTAIKGFASLLLEGSYGEISEAVHGALEKVYVSSDRLVNLIEDLLNVSRIESGRMTFTFENSKVEKILTELHDNFLLISKTKKFYLDLKLPQEPLPEIKMDASKIRELVSNFIDNALKYTEKGGVTISAEIKEDGAVIDDKGFVKIGEKSPYGKVVRITVSDTGIGIPKEEIPYLFRKFSRGKDVSRLHVGGTGLGLYVGKAIAEAHHGATWVESDGAGKGSRFIIEIPTDSQTP